MGCLEPAGSGARLVRVPLYHQGFRVRDGVDPGDQRARLHPSRRSPRHRLPSRQPRRARGLGSAARHPHEPRRRELLGAVLGRDRRQLATRADRARRTPVRHRCSGRPSAGGDPTGHRSTSRRGCIQPPTLWGSHAVAVVHGRARPRDHPGVRDDPPGRASRPVRRPVLPLRRRVWSAW